MGMLEQGKLFIQSLATMIIDGELNSYQNAVGSARKVVRLVRNLDAPMNTKAKL